MKAMELRHTDSNAADDSRGRAFGLEGNLYLPVVIAAITSLAIGAVLGLVLRTGSMVAGPVASLPVGVTLFWALVLRHGKPAGYDRDWIEQKLGRGDFTRTRAAQRGLLES